jgi:hypothetical protein
MPTTIPGNMGTNTRNVTNQLLGSGLGEFGLSQASEFGPMDQVMGQKDEAQEGIDGIELARAQILDVVDLTRSGKEGFNGLALVVEAKAAEYAEVVRRQVRLQKRIFDMTIRSVEFVQQAADALLRG